MPDLGHLNEHLIAFKDQLYTEGLNKNINSGRWHSETDDELIAFDHAFVTQIGEDRAIVGRLWASQDGTTSGRSHYPMIAVVEMDGPHLMDVLLPFLSQLESLKTRCEETTSGDTVVAIARETQASVDAIAKEAKKQRKRTPVIGSLGKIAGRAELPGGSKLSQPEMERLLWHIERELPEYRKRRKADSMLIKRQRELRPHHLRVPRCAVTGTDGLNLWLGAVREFFVKDVPVWIVSPMKHPWVDLIFGRAETDELACFRLGLKRFPLTTEIPYTIDPTFRSQVNEWLADSMPPIG